MNTWTQKQMKCANPASRLTCLVGCDVKTHVLAEWFGEFRDTIHSLHLKGVVCVGEQVEHHDWRVAEAGALRKVAHVATARLVLLRLGTHLPADHTVGHVLPATRLLRGAPLQQHACLVYIWNSTAWGWRRLWGKCRWKLLEAHSCCTTELLNLCTEYISIFLQLTCGSQFNPKNNG